ncbi:hypothetical protein SAY87_031143 [Trapa incisa]|uniref:Uncharacterized protein n=1 Tax=Trapa incisa TaxID=236973 RepID=A0AAN7QL31_9MYRT|nr:hypothetical protein SAY87_031143 [Trapa incisa]
MGGRARHHQPLLDHEDAFNFEAFQDEVSGSLDRLAPSSITDLQFPSLGWAKQCLGVLQLMNDEAVAKLGLREDASDDDDGCESSFLQSYLTYTMNLLDLFNSITSSLSHLGRSRLSLSHALALLVSSPSPSEAAKRLALDPIETTQVQVKDLGDYGERVPDEPAGERALRLMEGVGYWVCGAVLSVVSGDPEAFMKTRKWAMDSENDSLVELDLSCHRIFTQRGSDVVPIEVEEISESVASLSAAIQEGAQDRRVSAAVKELKWKLKGFEDQVHEINQEIDHLFSEIMASRNEVIDCLRENNRH